MWTCLRNFERNYFVELSQEVYLLFSYSCDRYLVFKDIPVLAKLYIKTINLKIPHMFHEVYYHISIVEFKDRCYISTTQEKKKWDSSKNRLWHYKYTTLVDYHPWHRLNYKHSNTWLGWDHIQHIHRTKREESQR